MARDLSALRRSQRSLKDAIGALTSVAVVQPGGVARIIRALRSELAELERVKRAVSEARHV